MRKLASRTTTACSLSLLSLLGVQALPVNAQIVDLAYPSAHDLMSPAIAPELPHLAPAAPPSQRVQPQATPAIAPSASIAAPNAALGSGEQTTPEFSTPRSAQVRPVMPEPDSVPVSPLQTPAPALDQPMPSGDGPRDTAPVAEDMADPSPGAVPQVSAPAAFLSPAPEAVLDIPSTPVTLQFPLGSEVVLRVNGAVVAADRIGRTETNTTAGTVVQTWYGVALQDGDNTLTAEVSHNGALQATIEHQVTVRGAAQTLDLATVESRIAADGRSTATVQGQLLDAQGNATNRSATVTLETSAGEFIGADADEAQPGFQVEATDGVFTATLKAGVVAQTVRLRATANQLEAFTQLEFVPELRPTLLTGVVDLHLGRRGTDFYSSFRDFLPADGDNGYQLDLDSAAFAVGSLGEWRFTAAYNTARALNEDCGGVTNLFRDQQPCDRTYPVYGDDSTSEILAPSTDSLYLRFERNSPVPNAGSDYFMWGDFATDELAESSQLYTSVSRQLHGFVGNYNLGDLQITGFYSDDAQGFQRDTLAPDGTSGYYFLSRRLLIPGGEEVYLELAELNRPGTVLERERLTRGVDYEIDYDRGTLLFRQPILRTSIGPNGETQARQIVATYQYESNEGNTNVLGGQLEYHFSRELNRESSVAATFFEENQGDRQFALYGANAVVSFGTDGQLLAEYAHSSNSLDGVGQVTGSAYRFEIGSSLGESLAARAYFRATDAGFSNNATSSFVPGQTRYGAELQAQLTDTTTARLQYDHEDNYGVAPRPLDDLTELINPGRSAVPGTQVDNSLTTISAGIQQRVGDVVTSFDWVHRNRVDRLGAGSTITSDQLRSQLSAPIAPNLTFRALNEMNLSGQSDPLYPNRSLLGLDWQLYPGLTLSVNHETFAGGELDGLGITSLDLNGEYQFGSDTLVRGRVSAIEGRSFSGSFGFEQGITLAPGLRASLNVEHVFGSGYNALGTGSQFAQPYAVGQSASALGLQSGTSYGVGIDYTGNPDLQASARYEHRTSAQGSNTVISANVLGRLSPAITVLGRYQQASSANAGLEGLGSSTDLRLGLAYRDPNDDRLNLLLKYEYRQNPATIPDTLAFGTGTGSNDHVLSLEAIYAPAWDWEFYGKYALRSSTSYLASDLVGSSTITLAQLRATHRFDYRWDITGEARWISQPSAGYSETAFSLEAGYYLNTNLRLSAGYSLGSISDRDFSGSRSSGGFFFGITAKLDNNLFEGFGFHEPTPAPQPVVEADAATTTLAPITSPDSLAVTP